MVLAFVLEGQNGFFLLRMCELDGGYGSPPIELFTFINPHRLCRQATGIIPGICEMGPLHINIEPRASGLDLERRIFLLSR